MMENIKSLVISLVIVSAVSEIVIYFSPKSSLSKSVKVISSVLVMIIFFMPFIKSFDFDLSTVDFNIFEERNNDLIENINESQMNYSSLYAKETVENILNKNDYPYKKVEIIVNINDDKSIYISEIKIYSNLRDSEKEKKINEEIKSVFKLDGEFYES